MQNNVKTKNDFFYKFAFIIVWLGATVGNIILVFCIVSLFAGIPPSEALLKLSNKAANHDTEATFVIGLVGMVVVISVIIVMILYSQFAEQISSLYSKKLFTVGLIVSSLFFLMTFMKICGDAGVCI